MTMDSLREIRIAEEKADKIRADAEKTARERIAAAHAQRRRRTPRQPER